MPPSTQLITEILTAIAAMPSEEHRRRALRGAAPLIDAANLPEALRLARSLSDRFCRAQSLQALARRMPHAEQPQALNEALAAIRQVSDAERRAVVLVPLADLADDLSGAPGVDPQALAREALQSITQAEPGEQQSRWLASLPPYVDDEVLPQVEAIAQPWQRALAWAELAARRPQAADELLLRAALDYEAIPALAERLLVGPQLFALLPEDDRDSLVRELMLEATGAEPELNEPPAPGLDDHTRPGLKTGNGGDPERFPAAPAAHPPIDSMAAYNLLDGAIDFLSDDLLPHALALAHVIHEASHRMNALSRLAPHLDPAARLALAEESRAFLAALGDEFGLASGLSGLARFYPQERLDELVPLAEAITDGWARAEALSGLSRALPARRPELLAQALVAARSCTSPWKRARALTIVAGRS